MLQCLFCDAELSDSLLQSGCCPRCGGRLMWPDESAESPRAASIVDPESPSTGKGDSFGDGPTSTPPVAPPTGDPPGVAVSRGVAAPQRAVRPPEPPQSSAGDSTADAEALKARVTAAWSQVCDDDGKPRHTIKMSSLDTLDAPSLVIRPRHLAGRDRPPVDQPDYELLDVIGEGGVGVVYAARQNSIDRMVAVKMLRPDTDLNAGQQEKFLSEAVVTGELEHPNIVPIYDLGSSSDGTLFYSMKRVQGTPWDRVMSDKSLSENLEILMKVCDAIAFAHSRGVIHRDLKPENVMLGGFGEVLVMDWGIALASSLDGKGRSIRQSATMGGTPAYMSPEMATGPLDRIGVTSDIYLLGGLLYESVTGLAPHTGPTVMSCLQSAAANEIQPTDKRGELVDIALRAMSQQQSARYQSVQEFQDAIRDYQSHAESIVLSSRAEADLAKAVSDRTYERFAQALFAFEEAAALWSGNAAAHNGVVEARRAYAAAALEKNDFELGLSLLDLRNPRHAEVAEQLAAGQAEQQTRTQRITMLKRVALALVLAIFAGGSLALVEINDKRATAESEQRKAEEARGKLEVSVARNSDLLRDKVSLLSDVTKERDRATSALQEEAQARAAAQAARKREQRETYVAQIGLAAERIDANAFDQAAGLLENYRDSPLAHWEWGRLWYMCRPHQSMHDAGDTLQLVQYFGDGSRFLIVTRAGTVQVWSNAGAAGAAPAPLFDFALPQAVGECALSGDARLLAVSAPDSDAIRLYELSVSEDGAPTGLSAMQSNRTLTGHAGAVTSLEFSSDSTQLLSGSLDHTARLWDAAAGTSLIEFQGHSWSVWQATFSPVAADHSMATAGQDGRVIVWSTADGSQITDFNEHQGPVYAVAFAADGRTMASAGEDRRILVWNREQVPPLNLEQLISDGTRPAVRYRELRGHRSSVNCLQFSPSSPRHLLSGGADNTLMVWDTADESGSEIVPLRGHSRRVTTCGFSPDGLHVLSGSEDHKWGLWDVAGFQEVNQLRSTSLRGHENGILAAHFAPNGRRIITASLDRTARLWDAIQGRELKSLHEGHEYLVTTAVVLPDGQRLLTSAGDNTTRLWDLTVGAQTAVLPGTGRHAVMAVSSDGRQVLTGAVPTESSDAATAQVHRVYARLWDLETQSVVRELGETITAELAASTPLSAVTAAAISPDGAVLYTGHADGQGRLWRDGVEQPTMLQGHTRGVTAAAFLPTGGLRLLTASGDQTVAQWDVASGRELLDLVMNHNGWVTSLSIVADGRTALTASEDGFVRLWDIATAQELTRVDGSGDVVHGLQFADAGTSLLWTGDDGVVRISDPHGEREEQTVDLAEGDWIYSMSRSPVGDMLALVTGDGGIALVAASTGDLLRRVGDVNARDATFTPQGNRLVCGCRDGMVRVIDVAGDSPVREWLGHTGTVRQVAVSGDRIASAGDDGHVKLWDAGSGAELQSFPGHAGAVNAVVFSDDGRFVASGGADGTVRLWSTDGGAGQTFTGHPGGVRAVAFQPGGEHLVSGGVDRLIRVWQPGAAGGVAVLEAHEGAIRSLAFSPDGRTLASLAGDRAVRLWRTDDWKWDAEIPKGRGMSTHPIGGFAADGRTVLVGNSGERLFRVYEFDRDEPPLLRLRQQLRAAAGAVWSATLTHDGASIVTVGGDAARIWNLESGRDVLTMRPHSVVSAAAYSPDGAHVVTGSWDHSARIWDAASGRVIRQLVGGHLGYVTQAAYLPDGRRIVTTGDDGAIRIWNADTGELESPSIRDAGPAITGLSLAPGGREAVTISVDDVIRIWDLSTRTLREELTAEQLGAGSAPLLCCTLGPRGRMLAVGTAEHALVFDRSLREVRHVLSGHTGAILAVAFSPDGKRLMTGSEDFTAKLWDAESGKEMLSLGRHTGAVTSVEFSRDGSAVVTAGRDGLAIVWQADAITSSVQTSRDRLDYRSVDGLVVVDDAVELNAPTRDSPSGLQVRVELQSPTKSGGEMGKLYIAVRENSGVTVAGNDVAVMGADGTANSAARLEWSDDARRLEITFSDRADLAAANAVLRQIGFQIAAGSEGAAAESEPHVEVVTFRVREPGMPAQADGTDRAGQELAAIEIHVLPPAETNAGSVLQEVESVLKSLNTSETEE